jgi:putative ABC transport system ATP-binding protein
VPKSLFHEKVSRLSIGQQQRVAASRAIIGSPEIIIADEPTSALDQNNIDNFMNVFVDQCKKIDSSLLFVSHDLNLSKYFDNTYELTQNTQGGDL